MKKMKIIKYGKKPEELEYVKKCPNCKTVYNIPIGVLFRKVYSPEKHGTALEVKKEEDKEVEDNKIDIGFRKENVKDDRTDK